MKLLIPHGRAADKYLVKAAQDMGHRVHLMCNLNEADRAGEVGQTCLPDVWTRIKSRYELKISHEEYLAWYYTTMRDYVVKHKIDAILPCSSMDVVVHEVAKINEEFDLPGIRPEHAAFFGDKTIYLPAMEAAGIRVPKTYEIVEPNDEPKAYERHSYPVIAKPGLGCGGFGIFRAETKEGLEWFFGPSDNPEGFSDRALFYQDRDFAGEPKSYLHMGYGGRYIVQEHIEGPCISLAGTTINGVLKLDMAYDIGITPPPTCAEISFGYPSINYRANRAAERCVSDLQNSSLTFPDGAWMADAILRDGELCLVDFAPRMSSSGTKMMHHACGDLAYASNVILATLGEELWKWHPELEPCFRRRVFYSFIPFPKGRISNIQYPDIDDNQLVEVATPIQSDARVYEMRNDVQVADRGWLVAVSNEGSSTDVRELVESYIAGIRYDVDSG